MSDDYIMDAVSMLGAGYEHPAVEIEMPRKTIERRNGRMQEIERAAFVKISTAFKPEMKDIDPIALKVWLYLALSINRNSGKAHPGLRTIAADCDMAVNTVQAALKRLQDDYFLIIVHKGEKRYNIYEPTEFVSARRETVSANDTDSETVSDDTQTVSDDTQTVSDDAQTVSDDAQTVSPRMILNQINQSKTRTEKRGDLVDGFLAFSVGPGVKMALLKTDIESAIKTRLSMNPSGKDAESFIDYAAKQHKAGKEFPRFLDWWIANGGERKYWSFKRMEQMFPMAFETMNAEPQPDYMQNYFGS